MHEKIWETCQQCFMKLALSNDFDKINGWIRLGIVESNNLMCKDSEEFEKVMPLPVETNFCGQYRDLTLAIAKCRQVFFIIR